MDAYFHHPYENDFTLIKQRMLIIQIRNTTCLLDEETDYLLAFASSYFETPVKRSDIVASFSGVRPLYNDGAGNASAATRICCGLRMRRGFPCSTSSVERLQPTGSWRSP